MTVPWLNKAVEVVNSMAALIAAPTNDDEWHKNMETVFMILSVCSLPSFEIKIQLPRTRKFPRSLLIKVINVEFPNTVWIVVL